MISAADIRSAIALCPSWQIDPAVDRDALIKSILGLLAEHATPAQAAHDCRIGLQSLGRYRSRHLSACVHVLTALSMLHRARDMQPAGCADMAALVQRVREISAIDDVPEDMVQDAIDLLYEHAQPADLTIEEVRKMAELCEAWIWDSQP